MRHCSTPTITGTLEVYPIPGFGALEIGTNSFHFPMK